MHTWKFCLIVWALILAFNLVGYLIARSHPWGGLMPGGFGDWEAVAKPDDASPTLATQFCDWDGGPPTYIPRDRDPEVYAFETARIADQWREWLRMSADLVSDSPGLRRLVTVRLLKTLVSVIRLEMESDDAGEQAQWTAYRDTLEGPVTAELTVIRDEQPDDALAPVLELCYHLRRALKTHQPADPGHEPFRVQDEAALEEARRVARGHRTWGTIDTDWRRRWNLYTEDWLRRHPAAPEPVARVMTASGDVLLIALSREFHLLVDACRFLGTEALKRRDFDEARLWYDTTLAFGDTLLLPDNELDALWWAARAMGFGLAGMRDWHALRGDLDAAWRYGHWEDRLRYQIGQGLFSGDKDHDDPVLPYGSKGFYSGMYRWSMLLMMALVATGACLAAWFGVLLWLGLLLAMRRRGQAGKRPAPPQWRVTDTLWAAGVALLPYCILTVILLYLVPSNREWAFEDPFGLRGLVPFAAFVPFVVGFSASRRVWRRLHSEGRTRPPFDISAGLFAAVPTALFLILYRGGEPFQQEDALMVGGVAIGAALVLGFLLFVRAVVRKTPALEDRIARTGWLLRSVIVAALALNFTAVILWHPMTKSIQRYWEVRAASFADQTRFHIGGTEYIDLIFRPSGYDPPNAAPPRGEPAELPASTHPAGDVQTTE